MTGILIALTKRVVVVAAVLGLVVVALNQHPSSLVARPGPTPTPTPTGGNLPPSIPSDCSADVTDALNAFIASVPNGTTVIFGSSGCYRLERQLFLEDRIGITLDGNGATLRRTQPTPVELQYPVGNRHINIGGGSNITIKNFKITGTNTIPDKREGFGSYAPLLELEHGIALQGVTGATVKDVTIDAVWGDGIYLGGGMPATNITLTNVSIDRNGRQGLALARTNNVVIDNVDLLHSRRAGFDFEPPGPGAAVSNIEIKNSYVNAFFIPFSGAGGGDVFDVYIHHNTIDDAVAPWIEILGPTSSDRHNFRVYDNTVTKTVGSKAALHFFGIDDVDIQRNFTHVSDRGSRIGVQFDQSHGSLMVIDNDFFGACVAVIANGSDPVVASGNIISVC